MKNAVFVGVISFLLFIPDVAISGNNVTGNVHLCIGTKALEDEWAPADKQDEFGIGADFKERGWPFSMAINLLRGSGEGDLWGQGLKSETSELNVGLRRIWANFPHTRPFIGGGVALIKCGFRGSEFPMMRVLSGCGLEQAYIGHWLKNSTLVSRERSRLRK